MRDKSVERAGVRVPADGVGTRFGRNCLHRLQTVIVNDADDPWRSDGYIQAGQSRIVHDDVRLSGQRDAPEHRSRVAMQGDQFRAVGRTEKTLARDGQAVRPSDRDLDSARYLKLGRVEDDNLSRLLNISVDVLSGRIINSPSRSTRKRDRRDHPRLINVNHRYSAVHPRRIADIEHEQTTSGWVVCKAIGTITDPNSAEQRLVRAAVDAHPSTATVG